jgi:predicted 3-demethylubiquinone-9 3-methyltransferase (glyoxalase superfamily)
VGGMSTDRLTVALNLMNLAVTQYGNYNFNSMCVFNGVPLGANEDGIYSLEDADTDSGDLIDAFFELNTTDFGINNQKRIRKFFLGMESQGDLELIAQTDEDQQKMSEVISRNDNQQQSSSQRVSWVRTQKGVYWMIRLDNIDGCDFSVDSIDAFLAILGINR